MKEDEDIFVKCKYVKLPWEKVDVEGHVISANLGSVRGEVILAGKEGERGKVGNKEFVFQGVDFNVLGRKGRSVVVAIMGKGKYFGRIYGEYVEGISEGEEVIGVVPLVRKGKGFVEVEGLRVEKELPDVKELKEIYIPLPYKVIEVSPSKVKIVNEKPLLTPNGVLKPGVHVLDQNSMVMYKGIVDMPTQFEVEVKRLFGGVKRVHKARRGLFVVSLSETYLVGDSIRELGHLSCYWDENLYAIGRKLYVDGRVYELPSRPYSCTRIKDVAVVSIPSAPFTMKIDLLFPTVSLSVSAKVPWEIPWGEGKAKLIFISDGVEVKEMEAGVYEVWSEGRKIYAFNLFGEMRVFEGLEEVWVREANGVLDVTVYEDYTFLITKYPPRLWVYKGKKVVHKEPLEGFALCSSKAVYAFNGTRLKVYTPPNFEPLVSSAVEAWRCFAEEGIIVGGPDGVFYLNPLLRINKNL